MCVAASLPEWRRYEAGDRTKVEAGACAFRFSKYAERFLGEAPWRFNRRSRLDARVLRALGRCPVLPGLAGTKAPRLARFRVVNDDVNQDSFLNEWTGFTTDQAPYVCRET